MKRYSLKVLPLVYKYKDKEEYGNSNPSSIVTKFNKEEWEKLIDETKDTLTYYMEYGIDIFDVKKSGMFLEIIYDLDKKIFSEKSSSDIDAPDFIRTGMLTALHGGGFPSFYSNNYEDNKMIDNFVYYIFGEEK